MIPNILVSDVIRRGKPNKILEYVVNKKLRLILSKEILDEFIDVIKRDKFKLTNKQHASFIQFITNLSSIVSLVSKFDIIIEDRSDNIILNTTYDGKVGYIVTGDSHLLNLKEFKGIKIVTADKMLEILESKE